MSPGKPRRQGRSTPTESARPKIDRVLATAFLAIRSVHVLQGFTCLVSGRSAYRRPRVATALEVGAATELAALALRTLRSGHYEPASARFDAAFGLAGLVALASAMEPDDRTASLNWMLPLTVGGCLGCATLEPVPEGVAWSSLLGATYAMTTFGSIRQGGGRAATAVANALSYPGFFVVASLVVHVARRMAEEVDDARREAVEKRARLAAEETRNREHRMLHDSALQTLEAIATGIVTEPEAVKREARREASALRRALRGETGGVDGLVPRIYALADEFAGRGLAVEVVADDGGTEPAADLVVALCEAAREALTNVLKHAKVTSSVLHVTVGPPVWRVAVRDHGAGFDVAGVRRGFGLASSITGRMSEVGGASRVTSSPGSGTRVEMWAPA